MNRLNFQMRCLWRWLLARWASASSNFRAAIKMIKIQLETKAKCIVSWWKTGVWEACVMGWVPLTYFPLETQSSSVLRGQVTWREAPMLSQTTFLVHGFSGSGSSVCVVGTCSCSREEGQEETWAFSFLWKHESSFTCHFYLCSVHQSLHTWPHLVAKKKKGKEM